MKGVALGTLYMQGAGFDKNEPCHCSQARQNTTLTDTAAKGGVHMANGTRQLCILLVVFFWCVTASEGTVSAVLAAEEASFAGTWVADGSKEVLAMGSGREAAIFKFSGHVHLDKGIGKESDYWAECIGLADGETGSDIRCVWKSMSGDEIYLTMKGTPMEKGSSVVGTITGGTGPAKGITGTLRFTWSMASFKQANKETGIGGFSKDLSGSYKLP